MNAINNKKNANKENDRKWSNIMETTLVEMWQQRPCIFGVGVFENTVIIPKTRIILASTTVRLNFHTVTSLDTTHGICFPITCFNKTVVILGIILLGM